MSKLPTASEKWSGEVGTISLGEGALRIGGAKGLPMMSLDGAVDGDYPLAGEVVDDITQYPALAQELFGEAVRNPLEWAKEWKDLGIDMICLRLLGTDPEGQDRSPEYAASLVSEIHKATGLPMVVYGCGNPEKDALVLTAVAEAMKGTRIILGQVEEDSYKTVSAAAMANGHAIVAFSNLDINLAKQMNILLSDFGVDRKDIIMDTLMAPLGMGLDYSYSVNERVRMAALSGDRMLQCPMICDASSAWQVGDASSDDPSLGDPRERAIWWEVVTGLSAVLSGADMVVVRTPQAARLLRESIDDLMGAI